MPFLASEAKVAEEKQASKPLGVLSLFLSVLVMWFDFVGVFRKPTEHQKKQVPLHACG